MIFTTTILWEYLWDWVKLYMIHHLETFWTVAHREMSCAVEREKEITKDSSLVSMIKEEDLSFLGQISGKLRD